MQMAVIEVARNVAKVECASSTEFGPTRDPVVGLMTEWTRGNDREVRGEGDDLGGTMRLGALRGQADARFANRRDLRLDGDQRTPSPPLRGQYRLSAARSRGPG